MTTPPSGRGDQPDSGSTQPRPPDQPQPPPSVPYADVPPYPQAPRSQPPQSQPAQYQPAPSQPAQYQEAQYQEAQYQEAQSQQTSQSQQVPPYQQHYQQTPPYQQAPPSQQPPYQQTSPYQQAPYQQAPPYQQRPPYAAGQAGGPGYPPPYYSPRPAGPRAGTAITSLVLGVGGLLTSFVAGLLAIIFGIVTLVRVRKTAERGAGMAIAGLVLGVMWTGLTILLIALGIYGASHGNVAALRTGGCFDSTQLGRVPVQVRYVPSCDQPHNGQVVGSFILTGSAWPGAGAMASRAATGCTAMLGGVLRQRGLSGGIRWADYYPSQQSWGSGARTVTCVVYDPTAQHSGSMLAGG